MTTHITNPSEELVAAAFLARDYYAGQFSGLYKLQCGVWDALTLQDIGMPVASSRQFWTVGGLTTMTRKHCTMRSTSLTTRCCYLSTLTTKPTHPTPTNRSTS